MLQHKPNSLKRSLSAIPDKLDMQMQALESRRITEREFDRARARVLGEEGIID